MTSTLTAITFADQITTTGDAFAAALLAETALQNGILEDSAGRSVGFAQDTIYRFLVHRPLLALERDRDELISIFHALGVARGYRMAAACEKHTDQAGAARFWAGIVEELRSEVLDVTVAA